MKPAVLDKERGLFYRPGTCDGLVVDEVFGSRVYSRPGFEIGEGCLVIDIGANIGAFALYALRAAPGVRLFCYEPEAGNFDLLKRNLAKGGFPGAQAFNCAVLDKKGRSLLYSSENSTSGCSFFLRGERAAEVETVPLKDIFDENGIQACGFLKIDAEGAERAILENLPAEYFGLVDRIVLEYHNYIKRGDGLALAALLGRRGFAVDSVLPSDRVFGAGLLFARRARVSRLLAAVNCFKYLLAVPKAFYLLLAGLRSGRMLTS